MKDRPCVESNSAGFGENDTRRMLLAAVPASNRPGLRLLRGSEALGYVCADTSAGRARVAMRPIRLHELRIGKDSGGWLCWRRLRRPFTAWVTWGAAV